MEQLLALNALLVFTVKTLQSHLLPVLSFNTLLQDLKNAHNAPRGLFVDLMVLLLNVSQVKYAAVMNL